jgi:23S rRNA-/tRNA-specific pseudouridylate synthase
MCSMRIAETSEWLVINKPAGWLTIAGRGLPDSVPILIDWVRKTHPQAMVVHRLDRETSGVILFALTEAAHQKANAWFRERVTKKVYLCLASGSPSAPILKIKSPIEGAPSTTQVEVKERFEEGFLASVRPLTGRRHQIRIHLSEIGHPLWGDTRYGGASSIKFEKSVLSVNRVALHAGNLELPSGERFEAPLPEDLASWLEALRKEGRRA